MFACGPSLFGNRAGDHPAGDGLTALQVAFAGASGADVSGNAVPVTQVGGTLNDGSYDVNYVPGDGSKGIYWSTAGPSFARTAAGQAYTIEFLYQITRHVNGNNIGSYALMNMDNLASSMTGGSAPIRWQKNGGSGGPALQTYTSSFYGSPANQAFPLSTMQHLAITWGTDNNYRVFLNGVVLAGPSSDTSFWLGGAVTAGFISPSAPPFWVDFTLRAFGIRVRRAKMYADGGFTPPTSPADWGAP